MVGRKGGARLGSSWLEQVIYYKGNKKATAPPPAAPNASRTPRQRHTAAARHSHQRVSLRARSLTCNVAARRKLICLLPLSVCALDRALPLCLAHAPASL